MKLSTFSFVTFLSTVSAQCPFASMGNKATGPNPHGFAVANEQSMLDNNTPLVRFKEPKKDRQLFQDDGNIVVGKTAYSNQNVGDGYAIPEGGYSSVRQDVIDMVLTNSKEFWPADFTGPVGPSYGGLLIRLAWHCNGTYRTSDGRGGCDGAQIRFDPVANWADNASLNMALELLKPVKDKHGDTLSWGDLIVLAADASIAHMGGPVIGFCGGRIDQPNGDEALPLGPSVIQQSLMPCGDLCPVGEICPDCAAPLGTEAIGLIYVEPAGTPIGAFDGTAQNIREVFGRMGFDDRMTVAAIGGGHAFGKAHGACSAEEQIEICDEPTEDSVSALRCHQFCPSPTSGSMEGPYSWQQKSTSGFEITWTTNPTTWDNEYFQNMFDYTWITETSPGGHLQWKTTTNETFPGIDANIGMFTTDLALAFGDEEYAKLSREYAADLDSLTNDFGMAWYQLMTRDMGPRTRCLGDEQPPIQPYEEKFSLGPLSLDKPNYVPIRSAIQQLIDETPSTTAAFSSLAVQCASTFRFSDYQGGCNGAAIRYPPSRDWESNNGASSTLELLQPIKDEFAAISWADLIVLAGQTAIENSGVQPLPFCGGRVDADDGEKAVGLDPKIYNNNTYDSIMYDITNKGLTLAEGVALFATPNLPIAQVILDKTAATMDGTVKVSRTVDNTKSELSSYQVSSNYFVELKNTNPNSVLFTGSLGAIVEKFLGDNDYFLEQYGKAFNYMMTADLFDGPNQNACQGVNDPTLNMDAHFMVTTTTPAAPSTVLRGSVLAPVEPSTEPASSGATMSYISNVVAAFVAVASALL